MRRVDVRAEAAWMDQFSARERFRAIKPILDETITVTAAAAQLGVSRKTLHGWLRRYHEAGLAGLEVRSSAPRTTPHAVPTGQVADIVALRGAHPTWGPRKLLAWLEGRYPRTAWPAASTMGELLRRRGLVLPRRRRSKAPTRPARFRPALQPNDTWCMDFKGHFALGRGGRCHPLTVQDLVSRYLLVAHALPTEKDVLVWPVLERLFRERGLPATVRHDNGTPFASTGPGGLSRLSVRFIRLGIHVECTDPASPAQNGKLERMHRVMKQEAATPPADTMPAQQEVLDRFRREYNDERPHEGIGMATPASRYQASPRSYPEQLPEVEYSVGIEPRRVYPQGWLKWRGVPVFIGAALSSQLVGIQSYDDGLHKLFYGPVFLGIIDERRLKRGLIRHPCD